MYRNSRYLFSDVSHIIHCSSNNPTDISEWYHNQIRQYFYDKEQALIRQNRVEFYDKCEELSVFLGLFLGYISISISGLLFGVKLGFKRHLTFTIGFIFLYIFLVLFVLLFLYDFGGSL